MTTLLAQLTSAEVVDSVLGLSTPSTRRERLAHNQIVQDVRQAIRTGQLSSEGIRAAVDSILTGFQSGKRLKHETALEALAVALETVHAPWAEEFLKTLASLRLAELAYASAVAKEVVRSRSKYAASHRRTTHITPIEEDGDPSWMGYNEMIAISSGQSTNTREFENAFA